MLSLQGANNQHVVPTTPQPWAEFYAATRWTARKGLFWGAADPPVRHGECDPHDMNSMGYRTAKATYDMGPLAEQYHVRQGGCHSCPIRCHVAHGRAQRRDQVRRLLATPPTPAPAGEARASSRASRTGPRGLRASRPTSSASTWPTTTAPGTTTAFSSALPVGLRKWLHQEEPDARRSTTASLGTSSRRAIPRFSSTSTSGSPSNRASSALPLARTSARLAVRWKFGQSYFDDHEVELVEDGPSEAPLRGERRPGGRPAAADLQPRCPDSLHLQLHRKRVCRSRCRSQSSRRSLAPAGERRWTRSTTSPR